MSNSTRSLTLVVILHRLIRVGRAGSLMFQVGDGLLVVAGGEDGAREVPGEKGECC